MDSSQNALALDLSGRNDLGHEILANLRKLGELATAHELDNNLAVAPAMLHKCNVLAAFTKCLCEEARAVDWHSRVVRGVQDDCRRPPWLLKRSRLPTRRGDLALQALQLQNAPRTRARKAHQIHIAELTRAVG